MDNVRNVYGILDRNGINRRNFAQQNRINFLKSSLSFSFKTKLSDKNKQLLTAGLMLYYGEGTKAGKVVDLANSDPNILKYFPSFYEGFIGLMKID